MNSLYSGVAGMQAYQQAIDVIANNVSNLNTVAFKAGRATFEETLVRTLSAGTTNGTNPMQVGMGVAIGSIDTLMESGNLRPTGRTLDMAIAGEGFFVMRDGATQRYTRDGVLQLNKQNELVMANSGMTLAGWQANLATGQLDTSVPPAASVQIPLGTRYAIATKNVSMGGNMNPLDSAGTLTSSFSIVDSLGAEHLVTLNFTKTNPNTWTYTATCQDASVTVPATPRTITFDTTGHVTSSPDTLDLTFAPALGVSDQQVKLDFSQVTQINGEDSVQAKTQDGLKIGTLEDYSIDEKGVIHGAFTNGANMVLGQVALATFSNPAGLLNQGNGLWTESPNSGVAVVQPAANRGSKIRSGYLESSNVDLATEFANLITTQRAFQANSRSITTTDEMMQDLLQLKR